MGRRDRPPTVAKPVYPRAVAAEQRLQAHLGSMKLRELRRALRSIVLAGLPTTALVAGCAADDPCVDTIHRTFVFTEPVDAALHLKIESCRLDPGACAALCVAAMERAGLPTSLADCDVTFDGARTTVALSYLVGTGADGCPVDGRRPAGLVLPEDVRARDRVGAWLARAAWLEAASIHAFVALAAELEGHAAPAGLVRWALASAADEVRHTTMMTRLALANGARPPAPVVAPIAPRSLVALAIENAIEGCVRETWGAALAAWQAHTARDPAVRAIFAAIAADELRHAALAWAIDRWLAPRLDAADRARVADARATAADDLAAELLHDPDAALLALGLPDPIAGRALLARARRTFWTGGPA